MKKRGFAEILFAMVLSFVLLILSFNSYQLAQIHNSNYGQVLNHLEGFYGGEIAAWHNYFRESANLTCTPTNGRCLASFTNQYDVEATGSVTSYDPLSYSGGPLNVLRTRNYDVGSAKTVVRRLGDGLFYVSPTGTTSAGGFCGGQAFPRKPAKLTCLSKWVVAEKIAVSGGSTCAVIQGGAAKCWGWNAYGELGNNSSVMSSIPVQVQGLTSGVSDISAGGARHACAIHNGAAKCWGRNIFGCIGNGNNSITNYLVPVQVQGLTSGVSDISAGAASHTCAIHNGAAKCWGDGAYGELGNNSSVMSSIPVQVQGLTSGVSDISAGQYHTCAIHNGAAKCWGDGAIGKLGNNSTSSSSVPIQVQGLDSDAGAISAGASHTCAIHIGAAKCWGLNSNGQLGNNSTSNSSVPVQVQGLDSGVSAISAGFSHTCAIHNGAAKCWGSNNPAKLGINSNIDSLVPIQVEWLDSGVSAVAAGEDHSCAIHNGAAKCWGSNNAGKLGNNSTISSFTTVNVQF